MLLRSSTSNPKLTLLPVRRAGEALSTTENMLIVTTKICAVQSFSGTLSSHTRARRPLHACAHLPPLTVSRAPNRSRQRIGKMIHGVSLNPQQDLQPLDGTPPPRLPTPCTLHTRANHVPSTSRATQTSTDNGHSSHNCVGVANTGMLRLPQSAASPLLLRRSAGPITVPTRLFRYPCTGT